MSYVKAFCKRNLQWLQTHNRTHSFMFQYALLCVKIGADLFRKSNPDAHNC